MAARTRTTASQYQHANWTPDESFCSSGLGAEIEGSIEEMRFHTVNGKDKIERYIALVLKPTLAYAVELDKYGAESSFDPAKHAARVLDNAALHARFAPPADLLEQPELNNLHPVRPGFFEFWALASTDARHLSVGEAIHLKTKGDSFFIKSFFHTKLGSFQNKAGGAVMQEMSQKANTFLANKPLPQDEVEGCDSDEWADD